MCSTRGARALPRAGCPIQKSPDHRLLPTPRRLSQVAARYLNLVSSAPANGILGDQPRWISPSPPETRSEDQPALWPVVRLPRAGEPGPGYLVVETKQQEQIARWQIAFSRSFTRPPGTSARHSNLAGSTFLAYIFETIPKFSLARSVSSSRPRLAFFGHARCVHRSSPVTSSDFETQRLSSDLRSPSGFLNPSGS
jgi:hypothetical protein